MNLSPTHMTLIGALSAGLGFFVAGAASLPPEQHLPPLLMLALGSIGAMLAFLLGLTNKGLGTKADTSDPTAHKILVFAGLALILFANGAQAQTATPTITNTPTLTPTRTTTPDPNAEDRASHVSALELTILKGDYDLPLNSRLCLNATPGYSPPGFDTCRCVLYVKRVAGVISLMVRCPDGSIATVTTVP